ncbi:hypothetical protein AYR62_10755 [Secundilactobacillus paracollinoides]|uniref:phosphate signaling complex protein PhoU n=1 Tax=Secundilactobacillus paracollinoides TaxID=240427 RepID=UPI0006D2459C|nr:phosphate signaling complex protein PhoU [Secundilactobacillus paracollinoides]ANZ61059.1 hypothetical protein AYR61_06690 [Secundilactobacillus paracollinoides]ANZ64518.1 hypothetical protein AYR62_10755 [Secundilactobacillus paracollinoides]KRL79368.1 phosphate uptake regulator PhoU [Secundilactobacillus paracollinoides DSM 15502 = JCM 11969]
MQTHFLEMFHTLNDHFTEMGQHVNQQINRATQAFVDHDQGKANLVITTDQQINKAEVQLEKEALELIALQQPFADNFRAVISILKASADLERIGDHATGIARETLRLKSSVRNADIEKAVADLSELIRSMLADILEATAELNTELAISVAHQDLQVDEQYVRIRHTVSTTLQQEPDMAQVSSGYLLVVKILERIGDHIVNLAEEVVYNVDGEIVELNLGKTQPELVQQALDQK